jgi:hypothetical protein
MSDKPPRKPIGRPVVDEKGNRTWTWSDEEGVDTSTVRALGEDLSLDKSPEEKLPPSQNPYDRRPAPTADKEQPKRRSLDDMRRLSEQIKRSKYWKPDK